MTNLKNENELRAIDGGFKHELTAVGDPLPCAVIGGCGGVIDPVISPRKPGPPAKF